MTLVEFFTVLNSHAIRLANVDGRLELRGRHIHSEIVEGARLHKETLLALLPPQPGLNAEDQRLPRLRFSTSGEVYLPAP
jgi:hypothetical protein